MQEVKYFTAESCQELQHITALASVALLCKNEALVAENENVLGITVSIRTQTLN